MIQDQIQFQFQTPQKQILQFLLVPDSSATRRTRRVLAEHGVCQGVVVGTWSELIEYAKKAYLVLIQDSYWDQTFYAILASRKDVFWQESFAVSPQETGQAIESVLCDLIAAFAPTDHFKLPYPNPLPERPQKHLQDLRRIVMSLRGQLPEDLEVIRCLLAADTSDAIQHLHVYYVEGVPLLTRWQRSLIEKLNQDAGISDDHLLETILHHILGGALHTKTSSSLTTLQSTLFLPPKSKEKLDKSVQWIGTRDFLQEAEVAAGMVQTMLKERTTLRPRDIGLLLPDSFEYSVAVDDAFQRAGLALSGLPIERWRRDLGREALFHFLYCRQKPAPAMALAVCLSSPLMPWSRDAGAVLAQTVMDGDYTLQPFATAEQKAQAMLTLIREGDVEPTTLMQAITAFVDLLDGSDLLMEHIEQVRSTAESLCTLLKNASNIDWKALRRASTPKTITTGDTPHFNIEGVTVWRESHEPWRLVRHLIIFGFATGHYPTAPKTLPVFSAEDLTAIRNRLGWGIDTPAHTLMRRRARFKRQLAAVSDFVTFLVPRRDFSGAHQAPSESLVFMQQLFEVPGSLVLELDSAQDQARVRYLAQAKANTPELPRAIVVHDLQFDCNLLSLCTDAKEKLTPESPSSLETLMVSRLAWLLRRLHAEPLSWTPESPTTTLLGTLAHQVFEGLFQPGCPLPKKEEIATRVSALLDKAVQQHAPFLKAAQWQMERCHLAVKTTKAAWAWREMLQALDATILGSEEWLRGRLNGVPIHGQADALLRLSNHRLLVVDYKRSSASRRRSRMQRGYDSQASLYQTMLRTGGPKNKKCVLNNDHQEGQADIVYFMLNDHIALSDATQIESGKIPGWEVITNSAGHAITLIQTRLREIQAGQLCLNRVGDAVFFDQKAGITPYALENSPLISLFTLPGEAQEIE